MSGEVTAIITAFMFAPPKSSLSHFLTLAMTATLQPDIHTQRQMQQPTDMLTCRHPDRHGLEAACKVAPALLSTAMTQSLPDMQQYTPIHMNTVVLPVRLRARVGA